MRKSRAEIARSCPFISVAAAGVLTFVPVTTQAAPIHLRISTPEEVAFTRDLPLPPLRPPPWWPNLFPDNRPPEEASDYWEHEGWLWRLTDGMHPAQPNPMATPSDPLSIAVPFFDYARMIDFDIEFQQTGSQMTLDATAVRPAITTADLRYPEDSQKEYVQPLGTLAAGEYTVTARLFEISAELDDANPFRFPDFRLIDYPSFMNDPLGYDLPAGFLLSTTEEQLTFNILPGLLAGDANRDLLFDQLDIVEVLARGKYLTGERATWGEGDWDGAPGGSPVNPPLGNGVFDQLDIIRALNSAVYLTGPYAASREGGAYQGVERTSLVYDARTGELAVVAPAGQELKSINVTSARSRFIGHKPAVLYSTLDNFADDNVFKASSDGSFGDTSFGNVLPTGLSRSEILADLSGVSSLVGGDLGDVDVLYVPEPSALFTTILAIMGTLFPGRAWRS